jgi:hypothetical protein
MTDTSTTRKAVEFYTIQLAQLAEGAFYGLRSFTASQLPNGNARMIEPGDVPIYGGDD